MKILIANDDGILFPGVLVLAEAFLELGDVYVVAPDSERSAASNSITLAQPLMVREVKLPIPVTKAYAISGTPADCIKLAMGGLIPEKFDLILSGINKGPNCCVDIFYSGTVGAAYEGTFANVLSMAVSLNSSSADSDYKPAAEWALKCVKKLMESNADKSVLYNLNVPNIPAKDIKGLKITKMGCIDYQGGYEKRLNPYGKPYYWVNGRPVVIDKDPSCDNNAIADGYVSLTPLRINLTDYETAEKLKSLF